MILNKLKKAITGEKEKPSAETVEKVLTAEGYRRLFCRPKSKGKAPKKN